MATKENFTPQEWEMLLEAPMTAGLAIAASSPSGLVGVAKESYAIARALAEVKERGSSDPLVKAVADELVQNRSAAKPENLQGQNPEALVSQAAARLGQVSAVLGQKAGPDAQGFKEWLIGIAIAVAQAAKENTTLGFGGVEVSDAEKAAVLQLAQALGVADPLSGTPAPAAPAPAPEAPAAEAPPPAAPAPEAPASSVPSESAPGGVMLGGESESSAGSSGDGDVLADLSKG